MKILQLVTSRQYRGAEVFAANLSSELLLLGHQVIFVGLYKNTKDDLFVEGAQNVDLAQTKTGKLSFKLINRLVKLLAETRPDVVQCNGSDTIKYMVAASFFISRTPILYRNISMISMWVDSWPKKLLYKSIFSYVSHISSVGEEPAKDFIKTFNYEASKVSVIRRGIPIKEISEETKRKLKSNLGFKQEDKIAVHIGNFSPEKNHEFLLDIFSKVKNENQHIKLICIGNGALFEKIQFEVKKRKLEDAVFILGFRKDIPELLAICDCFVLSSLIEGVPGVILEAATQKKPSIATNVGGVSEVLINGYTGYIIDDFDQKEFRKKLLFLLSNEEKCRELGENAFQLVREDYNPEKNAKKFEQLYKELIVD